MSNLGPYDPQRKAVGFWGKAKRFLGSALSPPWHSTSEAMRNSAEKQQQNVAAQLATQVKMQELSHEHQEYLQQKAQAAARTLAEFNQAQEDARQMRQLEFANALETQRQNREDARQMRQFEFANALETQRQNREDARLEKRFSHDLVVQEKRMKFEAALAEFQKAKELALADVHFRNQQTLAEDREVSAAYPLKATVRSLRQYYEPKYMAGNPIPPLVVLSPIVLEHEPSPYKNVDRGFLTISNKVADIIGELLGIYYNSNDPVRPVKYQGNGWKSKQFQGSSAIDNIHTSLPFAPTIVLESKLNGSDIEHYIGQCNRSEGRSYEKVYSISWKDVLYPTAKRYAAEWRDKRMVLLDRGRSLEELNKRRPDEESNLRILEIEEEDRELDIFDPNRDYGYQVNEEKYVKELTTFLGAIGSLTLVMEIDKYYLNYYNLPPKLPQILNEILAPLNDDDLKRDFVRVVQATYWEAFNEF
jgi:HD-GYP domain-containing protein (c-di-GMP phosphodiesterase class II)